MAVLKAIVSLYRTGELREALEWANEKKLKLKEKSIRNLSFEDLEDVLGDLYTELEKKKDLNNALFALNT